MKFAVNQEKEREKVAQLVQRVWTHLVPAEVGRVGALGCIPCPGYFLTECSPATIKKKKMLTSWKPCSHQADLLLLPHFASHRHLLGSKAASLP